MRRPSPTMTLGALRTAVRRHPPRVLLLWALGAVVLVACAFVASDPAIVMVALDPELVAILVLSSLALLRASPTVAVVRGCTASAVRASRRRVRRRARRG